MLSCMCYCTYTRYLAVDVKSSSSIGGSGCLDHMYDAMKYVECVVQIKCVCVCVCVRACVCVTISLIKNPYLHGRPLYSDRQHVRLGMVLLGACT